MVTRQLQRGAVVTVLAAQAVHVLNAAGAAAPLKRLNSMLVAMVTKARNRLAAMGYHQGRLCVRRACWATE